MNPQLVPIMPKGINLSSGNHEILSMAETKLNFFPGSKLPVFHCGTCQLKIAKRNTDIHLSKMDKRISAVYLSKMDIY